MKKVASVLPALGIVAVLLLSAAQLPLASASLGLITCTATLSGSNEVPPNASPATGNGTFSFDPSTATTTFSVTFGILVANATAAHLHASAPSGVNAAVRVPLAGFAGLTSGTVSGSTTSLVGMTPAEFAGNLTAGLTYVNIHSTTFPGGEIRGQLSCLEASAVPEFSLPSILVAALILPAILIVSSGRRYLGKRNNSMPVVSV